MWCGLAELVIPSNMEVTRSIFSLPAAVQNHNHPPSPSFTWVGHQVPHRILRSELPTQTNQIFPESAVLWKTKKGTEARIVPPDPKGNQVSVTFLLACASAKRLSTSACRVTPELAPVSPPCHPQVPIWELERQNCRKCSQKVKNKNAIEMLAKKGSALETFLFSVWAWTRGKNNSHERTHRLSQYRWTITNKKAKRKKIIDKFLLSSEQL